MGSHSKIKGRIIPSFCLDCSSEVHFYYNENESFVKEIKLSLENDEKDFKDLLDEKYMLRRVFSELKGAVGPKDKTHGNCPECGKSIPLIKGSECEYPKCGNELKSYRVLLYD